MSTEVTVTLPDELWERAQLWAQQSGRPADEFLAEAIELSLFPLGEAPKPIDQWTDDEVLAAADLQLPAEQEHELSELLTRQRESLLTDVQRANLAKLMHRYQEGLLRKAIGLRAAVARGLRKPLDA